MPIEAPAFTAYPALSPNPNPRAPLAGILTFAPDRPVWTTVEVGDGERRFTVRFAPDRDPRRGLPILGLRPNRRHRVRVSIQEPGGPSVEAPTPLEIATPPLPVGNHAFPPLRVTRTSPDRMEPGVTILSVRRRALGKSIHHTPKQDRFTRGWGMLLALDARGEVVWYYQYDARFAGVDRLRNGNLLVHTTDFRAIELDLLGNEVASWYAEKRPEGPHPTGIPILGAQTLHHQPHEMPNGHFLAFTANARQIDDYYTSLTDPDAPRRPTMVMGDTVVEYTRSGEVVWSWNAFDHLDPYRVGYNTLDVYWHTRGFPHHADWTHCNGLSYDERDDSVMISARHQDAMLKVDRETGQIKWILGEHTDWPERLQPKLLQPVGDLRWPYHQHNPRLSHRGTVVAFDNGCYGARPPRPVLPLEQTFSRGVEFEVDEAAMTVRQAWASAHALTEDTVNSWAMSDAHRLPTTDNMLVIYAIDVIRRPGLTYEEFEPCLPSVSQFPHGARIREYTRTTPAEVLFEVFVRDPDEVIQWEVYGGLRAPSLYAPGVSVSDS